MLASGVSVMPRVSKCPVFHGESDNFFLLENLPSTENVSFPVLNVRGKSITPASDQWNYSATVTAGQCQQVTNDKGTMDAAISIRT
jgi:hypothetical protein